MAGSDKWVRMFSVSWRGEAELGSVPVFCLTLQLGRLRSHVTLAARACVAGTRSLSPFQRLPCQPGHLHPINTGSFPLSGASSKGSAYLRLLHSRRHLGRGRFRSLCSWAASSREQGSQGSPPGWVDTSGSGAAQRGWSQAASVPLPGQGQG